MIRTRKLRERIVFPLITILLIAQVPAMAVIGPMFQRDMLDAVFRMQLIDPKFADEDYKMTAIKYSCLGALVQMIMEMERAIYKRDAIQMKHEPKAKKSKAAMTAANLKRQVLSLKNNLKLSGGALHLGMNKVHGLIGAHFHASVPSKPRT